MYRENYPKKSSFVRSAAPTKANLAPFCAIRDSLDQNSGWAGWECWYTPCQSSSLRLWSNTFACNLGGNKLWQVRFSTVHFQAKALLLVSMDHSWRSNPQVDTNKKLSTEAGQVVHASHTLHVFGMLARSITTWMLAPKAHLQRLHPQTAANKRTIKKSLLDDP